MNIITLQIKTLNSELNEEVHKVAIQTPLKSLEMTGLPIDQLITMPSDEWTRIITQYQSTSQSIIDSRLAVCKTCDNFNGNICELAKPDGCCGCTWKRFLRDGVCPISNW